MSISPVTVPDHVHQQIGASRTRPPRSGRASAWPTTAVRAQLGSDLIPGRLPVFAVHLGQRLARPVGNGPVEEQADRRADAEHEEPSQEELPRGQTPQGIDEHSADGVGEEDVRRTTADTRARNRTGATRTSAGSEGARRARPSPRPGRRTAGSPRRTASRQGDELVLRQDVACEPRCPVRAGHRSERGGIQEGGPRHREPGDVDQEDASTAQPRRTSREAMRSIRKPGREGRACDLENASGGEEAKSSREDPECQRKPLAIPLIFQPVRWSSSSMKS